MTIFRAIVFFIIYVMNTGLSSQSVLAETSSHPHDASAGSADPQEAGMSPAMLQDLLWFYRTEDPSAWNYSILGLSFVVLLIGIVLLGVNVKANRSRKAMFPTGEGYEEAAQNDEMEVKHASLPLKEDSPSDPAAENFLPPAQCPPGQVIIQWKDGNVTSLYENVSEEDA
ncbi:organic solute transporter subunit beta [Hemicordylus capensis]|uniref:organic solute transporter subunit beta n=1 Tax=Hemicordylus capensis TaxID=884348 RepID=UPI002302D3C4|nr:organic solute transporter subunit beta [Hemicordylus capensis]